MTDALVAIIAFLKADADVTTQVGTRIYGVRVPQKKVAAMPTKTIVVRRVTGGGGEGARSYVPLAAHTMDFRCYGRSEQETTDVYLALHDALFNMRPNVQGTTKLIDATDPNGPTDFVDPDTDWLFLLESWDIRFDKRAVT